MKSVVAFAVKVLKFVVALVANLLADLAQVEAIVPSIVAVAGIVAVSGGNSTVEKVAGAIAAAGGSLALAIPKAAAAAKTVESELDQVLNTVEKL